MEGVLQIEKEIEKEKEKEKEIAVLKAMAQSLQQEVAVAKKISEPSASAVSQADASEPTAGAMEKPSTSDNDKIRK